MPLQTQGFPNSSVLFRDIMKNEKKSHRGSARDASSISDDEIDRMLADVKKLCADIDSTDRVVPDTANCLADASSFTSAPLAVVKSARRLGCSAFAPGGRILVSRLGEWLQKHPECWTAAGLAAPPADWKPAPSWDTTGTTNTLEHP